MLVERFACLCCRVDMVHAQTGSTLMLVVCQYLYIYIALYSTQNLEMCTTLFIVKEVIFRLITDFVGKVVRICQ